MGIELPRRVAENIDRFTGRTWLVAKLLDWWYRADERIFLLTSAPGTGKSMIVAWLAGFGPEPEDPLSNEQLSRLRGLVKAAYFCQAASREITPEAFAESIGSQLISRVTGFRDALAATLADHMNIVGLAQAGTAAIGRSSTVVTIGRYHWLDRSECVG